MPTGTNGPDNLHVHNESDPNAFGLAGDDSILVSWTAGSLGRTTILVDGGADFDTLTTDGFGQVWGTGIANQFEFQTGSNFYGIVTFTNVERTFIGASLWRFSGELITGDSHDTIQFGGVTEGAGHVRLTLLGGDDRVILSGIQVGSLIDLGSGDDSVDFSGVRPTTRIFRVSGGSGSDHMIGSSAEDHFDGGDDEDELIGGGGVDILDGGAGVDQMAGGTGDDRYYVDFGDVITELNGEGVDVVYARTNFVLTAGAYVEVLTAVSGAATDPIDLTGNELNNRVQGNAGVNHLRAGGGNDTLDGGLGADILEGGTGVDIYYVEAGDSVIEAAADGAVDYVRARNSFALTAGSHVEVLTTTDYRLTVRIDLTGNEFDNAITGSNGINNLRGGDGADKLRGLDGDDLLDGGAGIDTLDGGSGSDRYYVDQGDRIIELSGEGLDLVYARTDYTLHTGVYVELLAAVSGASTNPIDLTGNELANSIQGNAGINILTGGGGSDTLRGLGGADIFRFMAASDSAPGTGDLLVDFVSGTDKIDLATIDANSNTAANDAFTFIGTGAFTGAAGELRVQNAGGRAHLYADINGDGVADMHIIASGSVVVGDFFL